ncbi:MAG: SipW-dependent-type signal peptide-containing protein [Clostridia bacterium]|nr:SipW-dependent-type signal peptide-containing protein [Clostridia bacterium]
MKKKQLLVLVLAMACIATISITATLAYFTDTDAVKNTFTVGHVDITLDETEVDEGGKPTGNTECVTENKYKLYPGKTYTKDPHIHIADDSEDCWVYVKVENGLDGIESPEGDGYVSIHEQMVKNGWSLLYENDTIYAYGDVVKADEKIPTFENFKINSSATGADLQNYEKAEIVMTAYAIQAEGFTGENGVVDAWNAVGGIDKFVAWNPTTTTPDAEEGGSEN